MLAFPPSGFTDRTATRRGVHYASWLRRAGAWLIDYLVLNMIAYLLGVVLQFTPNVFAGAQGILFLTIFYLGGLEVLYATLCLVKLEGQTLGMAAVRIRCLPTRGHGRLSVPQALVRSVCGVVVLFAPRILYVFGHALLAVELIPIVAILWPLIDARRQTWWDHLAVTVVLDDRY